MFGKHQASCGSKKEKTNLACKYFFFKRIFTSTDQNHSFFSQIRQALLNTFSIPLSPNTYLHVALILFFYFVMSSGWKRQSCRYYRFDTIRDTLMDLINLICLVSWNVFTKKNTRHWLIYCCKTFPVDNQRLAAKYKEAIKARQAIWTWFNCCEWYGGRLVSWEARPAKQSSIWIEEHG